MNRVAALLAAVVSALALVACGQDDGAEPSAPRGATLILDRQPNAVHAGIYAAMVRGFYRDRGVELKVREPSASTDAPELLESGQVDLAILGIHDLGLASEDGASVVGVAGIVQRPLAAVLVDGEHIKRPRELEGRRAGMTGLPAGEAVLDSVVEADGGDPKKVRRVTPGSKAVSSLAAERIDAVTGLWNVEGLELRRHGVELREFRVDRYGAPAYPELVLVSSKRLARNRPELVKAVVEATVEGYRAAISDSGSALDDMVEAVPALDRDAQQVHLEAIVPVLRPPGALDREQLEAWGSWSAEHGILKRAPRTNDLFDFRFAPKSE